MVLNKKYFLFSFLLLFVFLIPRVSSSVETVMNNSISLKENIFVSVLSDKSSYCEPEVVQIATTVENRGNIAASGNLTTRVFDPYSKEIKNNTQNGTLNGGESKTFNTNYTVQISDFADLYTIRGNFSYSKEYKVGERNFRIKKGIGTLVASPSLIERTMRPGDSATDFIYPWLLYACYGATVSLNKTSGEPGSW